MSRGQILRFSNFTGGEASIFPLYSMKPKYSIKLQNCHILENGGIAKIPGYTKVNTTSTGVNLISGFEFRKTDGTKTILAAGGGNIYLAGNELVVKKSGLNTSAQVRFSAFNNICIATNGVDAPLKTSDGVTWTALLGNPPATTFKTHVHKGRVWFIERNNKMLASHSALNNPETQEGYIDFKFVLKEGDELVDMATYIDLHIFFFKNHIAIYSGQTPSGTGADYRLVQLIKGVGAYATDTVQGAGSDCAFLSSEGVKTLNQVVTTGSLNIGDVSKLIDPTLRPMMITASRFASAHYPRLGWFFLLIGDTAWIYSYIWKAWARLVGADVNGMFNTVEGELYLCGNGFLYKYGTGYDFAGVKPEMIWETAWHSDKAGRRIYPKMMELMNAPAQDITEIMIQLKYDTDVSQPEHMSRLKSIKTADGLTDIDAVTNWDGITTFTDIGYMPTRIPLFGGGRRFQVRFMNISDVSLAINDILIQAVIGGV